MLLKTTLKLFKKVFQVDQRSKKEPPGHPKCPTRPCTVPKSPPETQNGRPSNLKAPRPMHPPGYLEDRKRPLKVQKRSPGPGVKVLKPPPGHTKAQKQSPGRPKLPNRSPNHTQIPRPSPGRPNDQTQWPRSPKAPKWSPKLPKAPKRSLRLF